MALRWPAALLALSCGGGGVSVHPPNQSGGAPLTLHIGPFQLAPGQETTRCITIPLGNDADLDAIEIDSTLALGSHHLILYKTIDPASPTPAACTPFEGIVSGNDVPIYIAETENNTLKLPSGVAYHLPAHQMVKLEAHYINATQGTLTAMGTLSLQPGLASVTYQQADIMFCGSLGQLRTQCVPPNTTRYTLDPGFYSGGAVDLTQLKIFAFTSHEHHLGVDVTIAKSTNKNDPGQLLYENKDWANPPLHAYDDDHLLTFGNNEGFRWQCSYDSADAVPPPTGKTCFGQSALNNEMCFIWAYYFPSVNHFISIECFQ